MTYKKPVIGIFDLDGTLGENGNLGPNVTYENGAFLRNFSKLKHARSLVATGRSSTAAAIGLMRGGISLDERYTILTAGVYEEGLFVEDNKGVVHNALNDASFEYRTIRHDFLNGVAVHLFAKHGYQLINDGIVKQTDNTPQKTYDLLDYFATPLNKQVLIDSDKLGLYLQKNDVRVNVKAPFGFLRDERPQLASFFEKLEPVYREVLTTINPDYERHLHVIRYDNCIVFMPRLRTEAFQKETGIEKVLEIIDPNRESTLLFCGDGTNDISVVDYLAAREGQNHIIVSPSNVSKELRAKLEEHNRVYGNRAYILEEDCTQFGKGLDRLLTELDII